MQIQDNVFVVTGGGSGLGAATAQKLFAKGGKVVLVDVKKTPARPWPRSQIYEGANDIQRLVIGRELAL